MVDLSALFQEYDQARREMLSKRAQLLAAIQCQDTGHDLSEILLNRIIVPVCSILNVDLRRVMGKSQEIKFVEPRWIAMYLGRKILNMSFADIGRIFGRDHSSVTYAVQEVGIKMKVDRLFAERVQLATDTCEKTCKDLRKDNVVPMAL